MRRRDTHWSGLGLVVLLGVGLLVPSGAAAQAPETAEPELTAEAAGWYLRPGLGVRVGGYGFQEVDEDRGTTWQDCRMNGFGAFATLSFGPLLFGEVGMDFYNSTGESVSDSGMERRSFSTLAAVGVKAFPDFWFRPFAQVGAGFEYSHVTWAGHDAEARAVHPIGFVGGGGEFVLADQLALGMTLRLNVMHAFEPQPVLTAPMVSQALKHHGHVHIPTHGAVGMAGQVQFYARFDF